MPSTNKTQHLELNDFVGSDILKRQDWNNDNQKIDAAYQDHEERLKEIESPTTTPLTTSASISAMPLGTVKGSVKDFSAYGLTLVNSEKNGDFSNGDIGWVSAGDVTNITASNNVLEYDTTTSNSVIQGEKTINCNTGDRVFLRCKLNSSANASFDIYIRDGVTTDISPAIEINGDGELAFIATVSSGGIGRIAIRKNNFIASAPHVSIDGNVGVHAINMNSLGLESLTKAQMLDLVHSGHIDGIQSLIRPKFEIIGKNKFNFSADSNIDKSQGSVILTDKIICDSDELWDSFQAKVSDLKITQGKQYTFKAFQKVISGNNRRVDLVFFDSNSVLVGNTNGTLQQDGYGTLTFALPENTDYIDFRFARNDASAHVVEYTEVQLEEGTSATGYEDFDNNILSVNIPFRGFNGVADRIYERNGQIWESKNIEEYVLQSTDVTSLITSLVNVDLVSFNNFLPNIAGYGESDNLGTKIITEISIPRNNLDADLTTSVWRHFFSSIGNSFRIIVPKGKYASIIEAQADLAGIVIQYHRATPQPINLTEQGLVSGELIARSKGTLYNYSDTFHAQNVSMQIPTNQGAQIASLLQSADYQSKQIDAKANKVQEDWIEPTLVNGWVEFSATSKARYILDDFNFVQMTGLIKSGITTPGTVILILPVRPKTDLYFAVATNSTAGVINVSSNGAVKIVSGSDVWLSLEGISFRVEA